MPLWFCPWMKEAEDQKQREEVGDLAVITMKQLLEAGVHFGHQTRRWNPKWLSTFSQKEMVFTSSISEDSAEGGGGLLLCPYTVAGGGVGFVCRYQETGTGDNP